MNKTLSILCSRNSYCVSHLANKLAPLSVRKIRQFSKSPVVYNDNEYLSPLFSLLPLTYFKFEPIVFGYAKNYPSNKKPFTVNVLQDFDPNFSYDATISEMLQAVVMVSSCLAKGDLKSLQGLVDKNLLNVLEDRIRMLQQVEKNAIDLTDSVQYVMKNTESWYWADQAEEVLRVEFQLFGVYKMNRRKYPEEVKGFFRMLQYAMFNFTICSYYRFERDFRKGQETDWIIRDLNHHAVGCLKKL